MSCCLLSGHNQWCLYVIVWKAIFMLNAIQKRKILPIHYVDSVLYSGFRTQVLSLGHLLNSKPKVSKCKIVCIFHTSHHNLTWKMWYGAWDTRYNHMSGKCTKISCAASSSSTLIAYISYTLRNVPVQIFKVRKSTIKL